MACKYEWMQPLIYDVPIDVWVAYVNTVRCPNCGATTERIAFRDWGKVR